MSAIRGRCAIRLRYLEALTVTGADKNTTVDGSGRTAPGEGEAFGRRKLRLYDKMFQLGGSQGLHYRCLFPLALPIILKLPLHEDLAHRLSLNDRRNASDGTSC